jgi:RNA polymerase sigma-70 factor (ECF subfamily)
MAKQDPLANPEQLIKQIYAYVAYRIGPGADAEDVTSATFERAIRARRTYDSMRGTPMAWLVGIARRCLAETLANRPVPLPEPPEAAEAGLEDSSIRRLTLAAAIARLDERDQELLALRYGADLTARRIAQIFGLRTNAVEVALHRAVARLRLELESERTPGSTVTGLKVDAPGASASAGRRSSDLLQSQD